MAAALRRLLHGAEVERVRPEPEPPPPPSWGPEARRGPPHRGGAVRAARGGEGPTQAEVKEGHCDGGGKSTSLFNSDFQQQEHPPYPGFGSQYWNSQPRTAYQNSYPVGPDLQGEGINASYANGMYATPYSSHGTGPPYANVPQSNTYYSSGCSHAPYPPEPYRTPSPVPSWNYSAPDCPLEGSAVRRQVPGYPPSQTPGFSVPPYPYGDCSHGIPHQGLPPQPQPRLQDPTWQPPGVYGMQPPYSWSSPLVGHGNQYAAESSPPWSASGTAALHTPNNNTKDIYSHLEQATNQHGYFSETSRLPSGTLNDYKPDAKPSVSSQVQYSAQPQLYDNAPRKPPVIADPSKINGQPQSEPVVAQSGIQRVTQVMEEVEKLEEEVDEFVGKKSDKDYRLLEEMLTKKLLELDSIETGGQDNLRLARKEAVNRIQAILEELERKGL